MVPASPDDWPAEEAESEMMARSTAAAEAMIEQLYLQLSRQAAG